jgi:hypothetical protein
MLYYQHEICGYEFALFCGQVLPVYQDTRQKQTQIIARDKYIYKGK